MSLQLRKPVPKALPAAPADEVLVQIALPPRMSPAIVRRERKVLNVDEKRRGKAIIVLPMLQPIAVPIHGNNMDVQMVHGRARVDATHQLALPVPPLRELIWWRFSTQRLLPRPVLLGISPISPPQLPGRKRAELPRLRFHLVQELGVFEGVERVNARFGKITRQKKQVKC